MKVAQLYEIIRAFGYATSAQSQAIAEAIAAADLSETDAASVRDAALEEAAKVCDKLGKLYEKEVGFDVGYTMASNRGASAIRALISKETV